MKLFAFVLMGLISSLAMADDTCDIKVLDSNQGLLMNITANPATGRVESITDNSIFDNYLGSTDGFASIRIRGYKTALYDFTKVRAPILKAELSKLMAKIEVIQPDNSDDSMGKVVHNSLIIGSTTSNVTGSGQSANAQLTRSGFVKNGKAPPPLDVTVFLQGNCNR